MITKEKFPIRILFFRDHGSSAATRIARESPEYTEAVIGRWNPLITGRLRLAFACVSILLIGAATGCSGSSAPSAGPGANSTAGGQPASAQSSAAPAWGAATHLDHSHGGEDPTSVSCPSASFCMAVLGSGYAARYDGTTWSQPTKLSSSSSAGEPDSVSCPTIRFCM